MKQLYRSASVVSADRVVFNIKGNDYRLVTAMDFEKRIVWIKWIGTHAEYAELARAQCKFSAVRYSSALTGTLP